MEPFRCLLLHSKADMDLITRTEDSATRPRLTIAHVSVCSPRNMSANDDRNRVGARMTSQIQEDDTFFRDAFPFRDLSSLSDVLAISTTTHHELFKGSILLKGHGSYVRDVTFIPGTRLLVTCSEDKSIRVWNLDTGKQTGKPLLGHDYVFWAVAASPDGRWIVSGGGNGSIMVWEVATKKSVPISFKGHDSGVEGAAFAPDSETFASASIDETVCVWKRETGEILLGPLRVGSWAYSVSYSPDGTKLVAGTHKHIIMWNPASGEELLKIEQRAFRIAFTPDGLRLVSGDSNDIRISDATTGDIIKQFVAHTDHNFVSLAVAPNGTKFATTSHDRTTRFFDLTTFKPVGEPLEHPDEVWDVAFSEDSRLIATGCRDKLVRTWIVPQGDSLKTNITRR
ncbi:WD40-repeat-containing domain protein [Suillus bovinus]|uniref:WD40-repeat-containing domain protein n=1 Tax=Suillus bovinus TaxID=48563 RepID=UPI001B865A9D|nr:WD40-repeat-containing domain protein [Suillus bovinus]KAG2131282.1 WD40-repeat-containing domain protein [Suillus bovinus]